MTESPSIPPRVAHNQKLAEKFGLSPVYPVVTKQHECIPFNRTTIRRHGYNPSIVRFGKRILMAYRWHAGNDWKTKLQIAEMDDGFRVFSDKPVNLIGGDSQEDPKLFFYEDALWLCWVESASLGKSVVRVGQLKEGKEWAVPMAGEPNCGRKDCAPMEKNWVPFSDEEHDGAWNWIYTTEKHWPWGRPKGGVIVNGTRFFHSTLDNESNIAAINNPVRRYYIGAMRGDKISNRPILFGSEASDLTETEIKSCRHFKSNVVFCSGAIAMPDGSYVLSVGVNDSQVALVRVTERDLNLE